MFKTLQDVRDYLATTPEDKWITGSRNPQGDTHCGLGWIDAKLMEDEGEDLSHPVYDLSARLFGKLLPNSVGFTIALATVNNNAQVFGMTPKQAVLRYLDLEIEKQKNNEPLIFQESKVDILHANTRKLVRHLKSLLGVT